MKESSEKAIYDMNKEILEGGLGREIGWRELWNDEALRQVDFAIPIKGETLGDNPPILYLQLYRHLLCFD